MVKEEILQFAWKHGIFLQHNLNSTCGKRLHILRPGEQNIHAGPDFFNARIRIEGLLWAGNVEIHLNASDWKKHGHHEDPAYDNVILHVVHVFDDIATNSKGRPILTLKIDLSEKLSARYRALQENGEWLSCSSFIGNFPLMRLKYWLIQLQKERFQHKSDRIYRLLLSKKWDREETLYMSLASGYGLPINSLPFEMVTSGISLQLLVDLRDNLPDLEAILFGQSGFLVPGRTSGPYEKDLQGRYLELQSSVRNEPVPIHLWKFLRLRPASFPTLRLSQFASLAQLRFPMAEALLSTDDMTEMEQLLVVRASEYWNTHYLFGKCSPETVKQTGRQFILTLIINSIIPYLQVMGRMDGDHRAISKTVAILSCLDAEYNHIIKKWINFGIKPSNAFESQALIHLHNAYCKQKRCLDCQIGTGFLEAVFHEK